MMHLLRLLLVFLCFPAMVWGQAQVINGNRVHAGWVNYGTTAGTATAYTLTFSPALPGYVTGQCFLFKPHISNTGAATLNVQGLGAKALTKLSGSSLIPLVAGDLLLNRLVQVCYDGTDLQLMGAAPDASGVTDGDKGDLTISGAGTVWTLDPNTVTYAKLQDTSAPSVLLGRGGAGGGGDVQEITLGANCSMAGTVLNCTGGTGGIADGDKGDVTVAAGGTTWTIDPGTVTYAKLQNVSATSRLLGRATAGAGSAEELTAAVVKALLGLTFGDITGTATAPQLPTAAADGTTKGIAAFVATDFDCIAGVCGLDYINGQAASSGTKGFLTATDWATFNAKQAALGFTAEDVARKNPAATLGTSNVDYPTQGAVLNYVNSGVKAMTNTALTPRPCVGANAASIVINVDNLTGCDYIQVAELSQPTTFDIAAGTFVQGQFFSLRIFTTVQRALTFTPGAGKFASEGITLPSLTRAGGYVLYGFSYNALSNRWAFATTNQTTTTGMTPGHVLTWVADGVEPTYQAPTGGGTVGDRLLPVTAVGYPPSDAAVLDMGEINPRLLFDNNTRWCAYWGPFKMNPDYASAPVLKVQYSMSSVIIGGVAIDVEVMAVTPGDATDLTGTGATDSYDSVNTCTDAAVPPTTAGKMEEISCPLTFNDSMAARDLMKVRLCRNVTHATDTAAGVMEILSVALEYTK